VAKTATATSNAVIVGDGVTINVSAGPAQNINCAPPSLLTTSNGFTAIAIPAGFVINGVIVKPPAGSTVTKTLKGITGDSASITWNTGGVAMLPINSAAVLGLLCNGIETVELYWY